MSSDDEDQLGELMRQAQSGDESSREHLFAVAYEQLRRQARTMLRGGGRDTFLDTTVLVHESFLRFLQAGRLHGKEDGHFFAYTARIMRSVIIDAARKRQSERRGGDFSRVPLEDTLLADGGDNDEWMLRIGEALQTLRHVQARLVPLVEMRYFMGMTEAEIARSLGVAERTVRRDWEKAKLLLMAALS